MTLKFGDAMPLKKKACPTCGNPYFKRSRRWFLKDHSQRNGPRQWLWVYRHHFATCRGEPSGPPNPKD